MALFFLRQPKGLVDVLRAAGLIILVVLALNTPHYLRNLDTFGTPLGPSSPGSPSEVGDSLTNEDFTPTLIFSNVVRNLALHVGTSQWRLNSFFQKAIEKTHIWLGIDINDPRSSRLYPEPRFRIVGDQHNPDRTGNPLHLLLIVSATLGVVLFRRLTNDRLVGSYVIALLLSFFIFCFVLKYQPWHSRLHLPLFVLWSPLVGLFYENYTKWLIVATLLMTILARIPLLENYLHPLVGERSIVNTTRMEQYFPFRPKVQAEYVDAAKFLLSRNCSKVGLMIGWDEFEHPLWALLPELTVGGGRLEHIGVTNSSAHLKSQWPAFTPCAIIAVGFRLGRAVDINGRQFRQNWSKDKIQILQSEVSTNR